MIKVKKETLKNERERKKTTQPKIPSMNVNKKRGIAPGGGAQPSTSRPATKQRSE